MTRVVLRKKKHEQTIKSIGCAYIRAYNLPYFEKSIAENY